MASDKDVTVKRCRKLTPEERKAVYAPSDTNAGAGWSSTNRNPLTFECGREREVMDPRSGDFNDE